MRARLPLIICGIMLSTMLRVFKVTTQLRHMILTTCICRADMLQYYILTCLQCHFIVRPICMHETIYGKTGKQTSAKIANAGD